MFKTAHISADEQYRTSLVRRWSPNLSLRSAVFFMLNPSTADAFVNDPTVRRCIRFAQDAGCGELVVHNLYAYRSSKPSDLLKAGDPVGPNNNHVLQATLDWCRGDTNAFLPVVAWGGKANPNRVEWFMSQASGIQLYCLGKNKNGSPKHPLFVPASQQLIKFN